MHIHHSPESYPPWHGKSEIIPLSPISGVREYIHTHPYILVPDITLSAGVFAPPAPDAAIGSIEQVAWKGMRVIQIGNGQTWYYPTDGTLILWELELWSRFRMHVDPAQDPPLLSCWVSFEAYLRARFPESRQIATPSWEPGVAPDVWHAFLTSLGFVPYPASPLAFVKLLEASTGPEQQACSPYL